MIVFMAPFECIRQPCNCLGKGLAQLKISSLLVIAGYV